jgi:hypothetical protein
MWLSSKKAAYVVLAESSVVGNPEFAPNEQKIKPIESKSIFSVHFTLNLPQASQFLGMTKFRWVAYLGVCDRDVESRLPLQARGLLVASQPTPSLTQ